MKRSLLSVFSVVCFAAAASQVSAQAINGRATGLSVPQYTIDFNSHTVGLLPGIVNDVNMNTWEVGGPGAGGSSFSTNAIYNFGRQACCLNPTTISFTQAVNGVAFNLVTNRTTSAFSAFLGTNLVYSFSGSTENSATTNSLWFGFENISFDRISVDAVGTNGAQGIDNIQVSAVPEPSSVALIATGLIALGFAARRRRTV